jgi:hypothetical protein
MRLNVLLLMLVSLLFIVSCSSIITGDNDSSDNLIDFEEEVVVNEDTLCEPTWKCISSKYKAYQDENCEISRKTACTLGCFDDKCKVGKICESGFKCRDNNTKGYQTQICEWIKKTKCQFGCSNAKCNPMPENYTAPEEVVKEVVEDEGEEVIVIETQETLNLGEEKTIGGEVVKIYNIDADQVKLDVSGSRSDWLTSGVNYTVGSSTMSIKDILFQPYLGGTKAVTYTLS